MTIERKWPGGNVERRVGRVGVMEREQWMVMEREQWVVMEREQCVVMEREQWVVMETTVGGDGDRGNSGW